MKTSINSQPPAGGEAAHTPAYTMRSVSGSYGFEIGYWAHPEKYDGSKLRYVPDAKGSYWYSVASIPGMGNPAELRDRAAFIVRACNAYDSDQRKIEALTANVEETERDATWNDDDTIESLRTRLDNLSEAARAALALAKEEQP